METCSKIIAAYDKAEETNPTGLILEQMFRFGKGWTGQKSGSGNCQPRRNGENKVDMVRHSIKKYLAGLEARAVWQPLAMSRGIHSHTIQRGRAGRKSGG